MKLIPSDHLKAHLLEQNVVMPEGGFDIPDGEYDSTAAELAQSPMHRHESEEAFTDRVNYALIWKLYGQQQNGNQRGVDLVNAQRMEVMTRSLTKMQDSSLPDIAQKVSAAVEAGSNLVSWSVKEHRDSTEARSAELVTAVSSFQTFSGVNHAEAMKVTGERHTDLMEIFGKLLLLGKWILGVLIAGFLFLAAIGIITGILGIHAHAQIDIIRFQDNAGLPVGTMAAPFAIKAGSNCSLARVNSVITFNCTGGAAAAGGSNTQVQFNNATALGGISTFTTTGTVNTAQAGLNWFFTDTADTSKKFRFDVSNLSTATTRIVNIPDANSTTVQADTGAANNFLTAISAQGVISKAQPACASLSDSGTLCSSSGPLAVTKTAVAGSPLLSYDSATGAFTQASLTAANVGLGSVTNDAQTKAAIVPNTAPSAGQVLAGNAGGTAYAPVSLSQDCTLASTGAITCTKTNSVAFATSATTDTTNAANISSGALPAGRLPAFTGDMTTSIGTVATTVAKVNGIAYSGTAAAHSVEVITTANTTATAKVIPDCTDATGNHLNYAQSTDSFSCGTSDSHVGTVTSVSGTANELASTVGATPVLSIASTFDIHGKTSTAPIKAGTTAAAPATCQANIELYIETDATAGQQLFVCNGTGNGWNLVGDGGGAGSSPGGLNTQVQFDDGGVFNGAAGLTYNKSTQTTTFTGVGTGGAAINIASQTSPTTPNAGDCWLASNVLQCSIQAATNGGVILYDASGNTRTDDTTGTITSYTVHHPATPPTFAAHEQTDACAAATCTQSWHPEAAVLTVGSSGFTTAANTSLQAITGLSYTMPANLAVVAQFDCDIIYHQNTAAVADAFGIQDVSVAPTNIMATAFIQTAATTWGDSTLATLTTTTATNIATMTPSAVTTNWHARIRALVEHPSNASTSVVQIMIKTGTAADTLTVMRGSNCSVTFQ